jgi:hypothetical protein
MMLHRGVAPRGLFERSAANFFVYEFHTLGTKWVEDTVPKLLALKERVRPSWPECSLRKRRLTHPSRGQTSAGQTRVLRWDSQVPPMTEQEVVELARKNYSGPLLAGEDLMAFRIGRDGVSIGK